MNSKIFIVFSFFLFSCSTQKQTQSSEKEVRVKAAWVKTFKNHVFHTCLTGGLNESGRKAIFEQDNSLPQDFPLGLPTYRYIDSIAQIPILAAKKDSTELYEWYFKGMNEIERNEMNGLPLIRHCLDFYTSPELDSIARARISQ